MRLTKCQINLLRFADRYAEHKPYALEGYAENRTATTLESKGLGSVSASLHFTVTDAGRNFLARRRAMYGPFA